jgi:ankyrin repeat protein
MAKKSVVVIIFFFLAICFYKWSGFFNKDLGEAAFNGDYSMVKSLLERGADPDKLDSSGWPPICRAIEQDHYKVVELLIQHNANLEIVDNVDGQAEYMNRAAVKSLSKLIALPEKMFFRKTPVFWALSHKRRKILELLIDNGANIEAVETELGWTPLHLALGMWDESLVSFMITKGADVKKKDAFKRTPLHTAVNCRDDIMGKQIIDAGGMNDEQDLADMTPLWVAVSWRNEAAVRLLLKHGAKPNVIKKTGCSLFNYAFGKIEYAFSNKDQSINIIALLLEAGADVNEVDPRGGSPLHWAVLSEQKDMVSLFLKHGAKIGAKDSKGRTPLRIARDMGYKEIAELLEISW